MRSGQVGIYLGERCPPNVEAYIDARLDTPEFNGADLLVSADCSLPTWLRENNCLTVRRFDFDTSSGAGMVATAARTTRRYVQQYDPDYVRQITQPRWHALGVVLGTVSMDVDVGTRASASMFTEYWTDDRTVRSFVANNLLGRAVFLGDYLYTPNYGGVNVPWWSSAERIIERRQVNQNRFSSDSTPLPDLFSAGDRRVAVVGRVSTQKGMELLIPVSEQLPEWEFAVVGPARDQALAQRLRARPNISLHGPIEYIEMPGVYAAADVLLSTSRLEWGGVSRAMMEARAVDIPVVALDIEDAEEVATAVVDGSPDAVVSGLRRSLGQSG